MFRFWIKENILKCSGYRNQAKAMSIIHSMLDVKLADFSETKRRNI